MKNRLLSILTLGALIGAFVSVAFTACKIEVDSSRDENPVNYFVSYQSDYGTLPDSIKDGIAVKENTVLTAEQLPELTAADMIFKGWYDGETKALAGEYKVTKNVKLKALWASQATVSYSSLFGKAPASFKAEKDSLLTKAQLAAIEANPYTFLGWFYEKDENNNGCGEEAKEGDPIAKDITLYAKYQTAWVTFKQNKDDNEVLSSIIKYTGQNLEKSEIPELTKTGYTFEGWFAKTTQEEGQEASETEIQLTEAFLVSTDITFLAKWTAKEYTITFNSNNKAAQTEVQKVTYGTKIKLAANTFTYDGYRFAAWNTLADGSGATYSDEADFAVTEDSDLTFYAQWAEADRFIITYKNTRGAENKNPVSYRKIEGAVLTNLTPPTGYLFDGWYDSEDSDGNGSGAKVESWQANQKSGDITLYAKWSPRTDTAYKVEHYLQNIDDDRYTLSDTDNLTGTTARQTNAVAKSYTGFTAKAVTQDTIAADGSTVIRIEYDRNIISYTFDANGGKWTDETTDKVVSGRYGATVTAPERPLLTGYTFSEWNGTVPLPSTFGTEALTFTASWTANTDTAYKVGHWQQNITDDAYTLKDTENLTGTTASQTNVIARTYTGFTAKAVTQDTIAADGSTIIRIEYDRKIITYTFEANGGNWNGSTENQSVSGKFGAAVTAPATPTRTGYTFGSWNASLPETFGSTNLTFTAQWVEGTATAYKVEHYQQNADDDEYTLADTDNLIGTTNAQTVASAKSYDNFTAGTVTQSTIAADGSTVIRINYTRNNVTLNLNLDGGAIGTQTGTASITGRYGASYTIGTPEKTGYTFDHWSSTLPAKLEAGTYTAIYTANTNTLYKVEHFQQNIDDDEYTLIDTDNLTGRTAGTTNATAKSYTGFTAKSVTQGTIAADGSTVIRIEYDRNIINYSFNANGGNWNGSTENQTVTGRYGAAVTSPESPVKTGYTFKAWSGTSSLPASFGTENLSFTATYNTNTNTLYKVEHYQQKISDNDYTLLSAETETKFGTTDSQTSAVAKAYTGFRAKTFTQGTIAADGSTVVKIYYDRTTATYTFKANGGNWNGSTADQTVSGKFGASVTAPAAPTKTGYTFSVWSGSVSVPSSFATENLTFTASYTANTNTAYKVEHYQQNIDDDEYTLADTDNKTGTTACTTSAVAKSYTGFTAKAVTQGTIAADGSTVIRIEYDRATTSYTFKANGENESGGKWNDNSVTKTMSGRFGASVTAPSQPARTGYSFNSWSTSVPQTFGTEALTFTASWTPNTNTAYKVEHYQQNAEDDRYTLADTDNLTGTTASQTAAVAKTYEHFTAGTVTQSEIAADGSTVVRINYARETVTITLELDGGSLGDQTDTVTLSGKYGQTLGVLANPTRQNYSFEGWNTVGGTIAQTFTANTTYTAKWSAAGGISVTVLQVDDIEVTQSISHSIITFTAENCDSYCWSLDDDVIGSDRTCSIDTLELYKGTYTVSLEAQKNGKWYSYFAQIKVLYDKALVTTAAVVVDAIQSMQMSGTVYVTGELVNTDIKNINTALKALKNSKPDILVSLDLSQVTGLTRLEDAGYSNQNNSFYQCGNLREIVLPDGLEDIGEWAFSGCSGLTEITRPSSVRYIGRYAFDECSILTEITIPSSVTSIGNGAFSHCSRLTKITILSGVTSIGNYAFEKCSGLTEITIPSSVRYIGRYAFDKCSGLVITILFGITSIGEYAFASSEPGWSNLTSITIPSSVTSIGEYAFEWCDGLKEITIPSSVASIGNGAFSHCSRLTKITILSGVTSIGEAAFYDLKGLTSITIPSSVTSISRFAFADCTALSNVVFETTSSWKAGSTNIDSSVLANSATAATYLTNTYKDYYWTRN